MDEASGDMGSPESLSTQRSQSAERRRLPRIPVLHPAVLQASGLPDVQCEIRDYCSGGLFLRVNDRSIALHRFEARIGAPIRVLFVPPHQFQAMRVAVEGVIVRVAETGLGISLRGTMPLDALQILKEAEQPARGPAPAKGDPKIIQACRNSLTAVLPELFEKFSGTINETLLDAADAAQSGWEQMEFFDARSLFASVPMLEEYRRQALIQVDNNQIVHGPENEPQPADGLSLVDANLFEDWLNLRTEMAKLETSYQDQLAVLSARLSQMAGVPISESNNPYGPMALGAAFAATVKGHPLSNAAKKLAYQCFAQSLSQFLPPLYQSLAQITAPILVIAPKQATSTAAAPEPAKAPAPPITEPAGAQAPATPAGLQPPQTLGTPAGFPENASAGPPPMSAGSAGMPHSGGAAAPADLASAFGDVIDLLNRQAGGQAGHSGVDAWAKSFTSVAETFKGRLNPAQVHSVQFAGAMLGQLGHDPMMGSALKPYLQKLQLPIYKQAIRDPRVLSQPEHPLNRLLDLFETLSLAMEESGAGKERIQPLLAHWTERLSQDGDRQPALFGQALRELETAVSPLNRARELRVERLRQTEEGRQMFAEAERFVEKELARRPLTGRVPKIVIDLLANGWRYLLVVTYIRPGRKTVAWRNKWSVIDKLLTWLDPEQALPEASEARALIDFVDDRMGRVCTDFKVRGHIVDELHEVLIGKGHPPERRAAEWVEIPAERKPEAPRNDIDPKAAELIRDFQGNEWLRISLKPKSPPVPLRLASVLGAHERFVFADRFGKKAFELTAAEFADYLRDGRAERAPDLDLTPTERAFTRNIETGQRYLLHDPATGLLTRKTFLSRLKGTAARADKQAVADRMIGVLAIDQIRVINSVCGGDACDELLQSIGRILKNIFDQGEYGARLGDNQIGVHLRRCEPGTVPSQAGALRNAIRDFRFDWGDRSFALDAQIGLAWFDPATADPAEVLKDAELACNRATELGPGNVQLFAETDSSLSTAQRVLDWAGRLEPMLSGNLLFPRCQKIAPVSDPNGKASHYEILLGVRDETGKVIPPSEFIMAAERWQFMVDLDRWQVKSVFDWISRNRARFETIGGFAINLSGQSLTSNEFLAFLQGALAEADWPVEKITFEITETAAIAQLGQAEKFIRQIKRFGCRFSLDDFGSGLASYAYLKHLKVDYLKIDGVFVRDLAHSETDFVIVKSMNEVAHLFNMKTIAEYVESEAILEKLGQVGIDYAQGYYLGKPCPLSDLENGG